MMPPPTYGDPAEEWRRLGGLFPGVAPGRYAVSVFHDENSNGKMDTNFIGIPREGVGASNNAKGHLGPQDSMTQLFNIRAASSI